MLSSPSPPSVQRVHLIRQQQGQLNPSMLCIIQVDGVCGSGGGLSGIGSQGRGLCGQVGLTRVAEGELRRGSVGRAGRAAGQQSPQGPFEVTHEQRVDNGVHGAVTVAQPSDGIEECRGNTLAYRLTGERKGNRQALGVCSVSTQHLRFCETKVFLAEICSLSEI